jgi:hypothetical protein
MKIQLNLHPMNLSGMNLPGLIRTKSALALVVLFTISAFCTSAPHACGASVSTSTTIVEPGFALISPLSRATLTPGQTLTVRFRADYFTPSATMPITVNLAARDSWKRIRIGFFDTPSPDGYYTLSWTPGESYYSSYRSLAGDPYFKIEIRAWNAKWYRSLSRISLVRLRKPRVTGENAVTGGATGGDAGGNVTGGVTADGEGAGLNDPVIPAGAVLASRYSFRSTYEHFTIERLTAVNDTQGDGFEADPGETAAVLEKVFIRYKDAEGRVRTAEANPVGGRAVFSDLSLFAARYGSADIELFAQTVDPARFGELYSGQTFRLGLLESGNTASTFRAVGMSSGSVLNSPTTFNPAGWDIHEFVTREATPVFALTLPMQQPLFNGEQVVYGFSVDSASNAGLARLVFDVSSSGLTSLDRVRVFRDGHYLQPGDAGSAGEVYLMWDAGAVSCFAHTEQAGAGTGMDCAGAPASSTKLIMAFSREEKPFGNAPVNYQIRMNALGVDTGDRVAVRLATGDDAAALSVGGAVDNTGFLYNGGAGNELFGVPTDFASEATSLPNHNIIWSDSSADAHLYPSVSPGLPPSIGSNGSADFTNGYLFNLNALPYIISIR